MHLQTLEITINQSLIGKVRLLLTTLHHTVRTQTRFFTRKGSGTFFVYQRFRGRTTRNGKQERAKAGYHRGDGILPFVLYGAFWGNRCVRRKKGKVLAYRGVLSTDGMVYSTQQILLMCLSRVFYRFFDFLLEKGRIKLNPQQLWIFEKTI